MFRHVREPAGPIPDVEVRVAEPRIPVPCVAAPRAPRHVIVEVDVDLLARALLRHSVEHLQARGLLVELRVLVQEFGKSRRAVRSPQRLCERRLHCDVCAPVLLDLVDHLDRVRQADRVHPYALDLRYHARDRLVRQPVRDHHLPVPRPVRPGVYYRLAARVLRYVVSIDWS